MSASPPRGPLAERLLSLAEEAGRLVREVYETDFEVESKGTNDVVTVADRAANDLLCAALGREFPGIPVVAEESDAACYAGFERAPSAFFVDPLDGTREFVARNGQFVVMIGYAEAGRAVAGALYAPTTGIGYCGAVDSFAFQQAPSGLRAPLHVSDVADLARARVVVSRSRRSPDLEAALTSAGVRSVEPLGSAGHKGAAVARGAAEAYVQLGRAGSLWDLCAPDALVTAAGGRFTDAAGTPIDYARTTDVVHHDGLVVSNALLHDAFVRLLASAD